MQGKYQRPISKRRESRSLGGRFKGGKLAPVMAVPMRESETAILSQSINYELDPIAGRMITPITAEMIAVYVPMQAVDAIKNPEEAYAGMTEAVREKLLSGTPLFGLEDESELSKRLGINPRSINGVKKVNEVGRLAHNAAVNYLRQRKFVDTVKVLADNMAVTPAIISDTVLDRLNGVLDPEDRVNGAVELDFGVDMLPVKGIGVEVGYSTVNQTTAGQWKDADGDNPKGHMFRPLQQDWFLRADGPNGDPAPYADLSGAAAGRVSLTDFYNAELMDTLTRQMRQMIDDNPEYGEEMITRWAHGLSVDTGKTPWVIYERQMFFGNRYREAMDGPNLDVAQSDMAQNISFTVPVPATELGGIIITFACVKPDETLESQPHPFLSEPWTAQNFVSDELARDPVPVTIRDLFSDCAPADENTRALYVGHNGLKRTYISYGFNRHLDLDTVENQTALWQLNVPMSVTPESVLYPEELEHYPFADQEAEVCTYAITSQAVVSTPMIFGPTPVEDLDVLDDENLFEVEPEA